PFRSRCRGRGQSPNWFGSAHVWNPLWYRQSVNAQYPWSLSHLGLVASEASMAAHVTFPCRSMYPSATASEISWWLSSRISQSKIAGVSWSSTATTRPASIASCRRSSMHVTCPAILQTRRTRDWACFIPLALRGMANRRGTSDQRHQPALGVGVAVDVPLGCLNGSVASENLHVPERPTGFMNEAGSAGDEGPPPRVR